MELPRPPIDRVSRRPSVAVLMPAHDEGERVYGTLADLAAERRATFTVFLVDDGGRAPVDRASALRAAADLRVVLARHPVNLGQGAALETARRLALAERSTFDAYVTMDADGQHRAADVVALADAIIAGADIALGDRFSGGSNVPRARRALLGAARLFERTLTGLALSDAHNGLRAWNRRAAARMQMRQTRMAHASELTALVARAARDGFVVVEVPVSVRYSPAVSAKGQSAAGAVAIVVDLVHGFLFGSEPS